tara:strand:- start:1486 stop:1629 length:144 start_codon:yes stop_codon:yes gene_type:complete
MRLVVAFETGPSKFYVKKGLLVNEDIIFNSGKYTPFPNLKDRVPNKK